MIYYNKWHLTMTMLKKKKVIYFYYLNGSWNKPRCSWPKNVSILFYKLYALLLQPFAIIIILKFSMFWNATDPKKKKMLAHIDNHLLSLCGPKTFGTKKDFLCIDDYWLVYWSRKNVEEIYLFSVNPFISDAWISLQHHV